MCPFFRRFAVLQNPPHLISETSQGSKLFKALVLLRNYRFKVLAVFLDLQLQLSLDLKLFMKLFLHANLCH